MSMGDLKKKNNEVRVGLHVNHIPNWSNKLNSRLGKVNCVRWHEYFTIELTCVKPMFFFLVFRTKLTYQTTSWNSILGRLKLNQSKRKTTNRKKKKSKSKLNLNFWISLIFFFIEIKWFDLVLVSSRKSKPNRIFIYYIFF